MSKTTKRKHVTKEILDDYYVPEGDESIVRVLGGRGNNLHEVEAADKSQFLVSMPSKFRKNVWIKRGDFVIIEPIKEGNKVQAEIVYVLYPKQIKYLKNEGLWPKEFSEKEEEKCPNPPASTKQAENSGSDSEDDGVLFENPNRRPVVYCPDDSETSSEEDSDVEGDAPDDDATETADKKEGEGSGMKQADEDEKSPPE